MLNRRLWRVDFETTGLEKAEIWKLLVNELHDTIGFAHVDLIPDDRQLLGMGASGDVRWAVRTLALAARRDSNQAVPSSSGPAPLGIHIELADETTFAAFVVYGPYSIKIDVWRNDDRGLLAVQPSTSTRPRPLIEQIDSMSAVLVSLNDNEVDVLTRLSDKGLQVATVG